MIKIQALSRTGWNWNPRSCICWLGNLGLVALCLCTQVTSSVKWAYSAYQLYGGVK